MKPKIIIDTDPGQDDAMAIMLAVKSDMFDIMAITTVCGNSTIENTTRNARYILEVLERTDIPVYSGARKPLKRKLIQAIVHGKSGLEGINPTNKPSLTKNAIDKILSLVNKYPYEVTIVTLGPLTNIAQAIIKDPKTMKKVKEIISMGGAINVAGNKNRVAEFNIFVDPEAAKIVFEFPVKKTIVPLDVCNKIKLSFDEFKKIKNKNIKRILIKTVKPYIDNLAKDAGVKAAMMYDPLTVYFLMKKVSCKSIYANVQVETEGIVTRGMTVIDKRIVTDGYKPNLEIITYISEQKFKNVLLSVLSR